MTPLQKIKWAILNTVANCEGTTPPNFPLDNVDALYKELVDEGKHYDAKEEIRSCAIRTGLPAEYSRYYESDAVAMKFPDGSWVGWTYYRGGGKHGQPGEMDWMEDAYSVNCVEVEKTIVTHEFSLA